MEKRKMIISQIEYHGLVNNERFLSASSLSQLKRLASRYANNDYRSIDEMRVTIHDVRRCENTDIFWLTRINKVCPNNTIKRGAWN